MDVARIEVLLHQALERFQPPDLSIGMGLLGQAISACELARSDRSVDAEAWGMKVVERFNAHGGAAGLYDGLAGMGLLFALYIPGAEELLESVDHALLPHLPSLPPTSLRNGLAGLAIYASTRSQSPSGQALQRALVHYLAAVAVADGEGLVWNTDPAYARQRTLDASALPVREFGMAHGMAAILVALSALARQGHGPAREMGGRALRWMESHARAAPNRYGWFELGGRDELANPATWCTGDPGAIRARYLCAQACGDMAAVNRALEMARDLAAHWTDLYAPSRREALIDLCCGSTAVAQILRRFHLDTGETIFQSASAAIFAQSERELDSLHSDSFQFGKLGVLTALLSFASNRAPTWDCVLGLSYPESLVAASLE